MVRIRNVGALGDVEYGHGITANGTDDGMVKRRVKVGVKKSEMKLRGFERRRGGGSGICRFEPKDWG